ncbi:MAG: hypothetical protein RMJ31_07490 [Nitrososphaerota archaeon]|nr:hypothetical protein [Nitrososphaerota archaeon]
MIEAIKIRKFALYNTKLLVLALGLMIFLGICYRDKILYLYKWIPEIFYSPPFSNFEFELITNGKMILTLCGLSLPFAIFGFFKDKVLLTLLVFTTIGSLSTTISPSFLLGGVLPWRYILLLAIPISFYAINGIWRLCKNLKPLKLASFALMMIIITNVGSLSFLGINNNFRFYEFSGIIPPNMVSTSIPLYDIEPTIELLKSVQDKDATILVYGDFVGWALYYTNAEVISFGGTYHSAPTLDKALQLTKNHNNLYLLWWDSNIASSLGFKLIRSSGYLQLYKYSVS